MRTPAAASSSLRRWITSRLKLIRNATSSGCLRQFSVENAYAEMYLTPSSMRAHEHVHQGGLADLVPLGPRQPALLRPPAVAVHHDRDVPGHQLTRGSPAGGCRSGAGTAAAPDGAPAAGGILLKHAPHDATTGSNAPGATAGTRPPGHCTLPGACARSASLRPSRPRSSATISATVCGAGDAEPGGRQSAHTIRPPDANAREAATSGPGAGGRRVGAPQRAHSSSAGA